MATIRLAQFFDLVVFNDSGQRVGRHRYQNYFVKERKEFDGSQFDFAPFRVEGSSASLTGENTLLQVLFPAEDIVLQLLEQGNGNRLSLLKLTYRWLNEKDDYLRSAPKDAKNNSENYVGVGASFSETTVELRFRASMDSVGAEFPRRTFSKNLVGILPSNADIVLQ
jgi:hypothetical protein